MVILKSIASGLSRIGIVENTGLFEGKNVPDEVIELINGYDSIDTFTQRLDNIDCSILPDSISKNIGDIPRITDKEYTLGIEAGMRSVLLYYLNNILPKVQNTQGRNYMQSVRAKVAGRAPVSIKDEIAACYYRNEKQQADIRTEKILGLLEVPDNLLGHLLTILESMGPVINSPKLQKTLDWYREKHGEEREIKEKEHQFSQRIGVELLDIVFVNMENDGLIAGALDGEVVNEIIECYIIKKQVEKSIYLFQSAGNKNSQQAQDIINALGTLIQKYIIIKRKLETGFLYSSVVKNKLGYDTHTDFPEILYEPHLFQLFQKQEIEIDGEKKIYNFSETFISFLFELLICSECVHELCKQKIPDIFLFFIQLDETGNLSEAKKKSAIKYLQNLEKSEARHEAFHITILHGNLEGNDFLSELTSKDKRNFLDRFVDKDSENITFPFGTEIFSDIKYSDYRWLCGLDSESIKIIVRQKISIQAALRTVTRIDRLRADAQWIHGDFKHYDGIQKTITASVGESIEEHDSQKIDTFYEDGLLEYYVAFHKRIIGESTHPEIRKATLNHINTLYRHIPASFQSHRESCIEEFLLLSDAYQKIFIEALRDVPVGKINITVLNGDLFDFCMLLSDFNGDVSILEIIDEFVEDMLRKRLENKVLSDAEEAAQENLEMSSIELELLSIFGKNIGKKIYALNLSSESYEAIISICALLTSYNVKNFGDFIQKNKRDFQKNTNIGEKLHLLKRVIVLFLHHGVRAYEKPENFFRICFDAEITTSHVDTLYDEFYNSDIEGNRLGDFINCVMRYLKRRDINVILSYLGEKYTVSKGSEVSSESLPDTTNVRRKHLNERVTDISFKSRKSATAFKNIRIANGNPYKFKEVFNSIMSDNSRYDSSIYIALISRYIRFKKSFCEVCEQFSEKLSLANTSIDVGSMVKLFLSLQHISYEDVSVEFMQGIFTIVQKSPTSLSPEDFANIMYGLQNMNPGVIPEGMIEDLIGRINLRHTRPDVGQIYRILYGIQDLGDIEAVKNLQELLFQELEEPRKMSKEDVRRIAKLYTFYRKSEDIPEYIRSNFTHDKQYHHWEQLMVQAIRDMYPPEEYPGIKILSGVYIKYIECDCVMIIEDENGRKRGLNIEHDGPQHEESIHKDNRRDNLLLSDYEIKTLRIKCEGWDEQYIYTQLKKHKEEIDDFVFQHKIAA